MNGVLVNETKPVEIEHTNIALEKCLLQICRHLVDSMP